MKRFATLLLMGCFIAIAAPVGAIELGLGFTAFDVSRTGGGETSADIATDISLEVSLFGPVRVGASFSRFGTGSGSDFFGDEYDVEQQILAGFVLAEFFSTEAVTPYLRIAGGSYKSKITSQSIEYESDGTVGAVIGFGARAYLKRFVSVSGEVQYHYTDLGTEQGFEKDDSLLRLLVGVEVWWAPGGSDD